MERLFISLFCTAIAVIIFIIVYLAKHFYNSFTCNQKNINSIFNKVNWIKLNKYILLILWIILLILELIKMNVFAFFYHDDRIWLYVPLHICSMPIYFLPFLIFLPRDNKIRGIAVNFVIITLFLCLLTFIFGIDTPNIFSKSYPGNTSLFYCMHTYFWHMVLCLTFLYLVIFRFENMAGEKILLQTAYLIFVVNAFIFFSAEMFLAANINAPEWILYNHNSLPFYEWCNKNPYLTNLLLFAFTITGYEVMCFVYFLVDKKCTALHQKNIPKIL